MAARGGWITKKIVPLSSPDGLKDGGEVSTCCVLSHMGTKPKVQRHGEGAEASVVRTSMCYRRVGKPTCLAMPLAVVNNRETGKLKFVKFPRRGPPLLLSKKKIPSHRGPTYKRRPFLELVCGMAVSGQYTMHRSPGRLFDVPDTHPSQPTLELAQSRVLLHPND